MEKTTEERAYSLKRVMDDMHRQFLSEKDRHHPSFVFDLASIMLVYLRERTFGFTAKDFHAARNKPSHKKTAAEYFFLFSILTPLAAHGETDEETDTLILYFFHEVTNDIAATHVCRLLRHEKEISSVTEM